jgi:cytochrome c oxidase subunit II
VLLAEVPLFPDQASISAERVDALFFFMVAVSTFFSVLIAGLVFYFAIKYRRRCADERPARMEGSMSLEVFWSVVPLVISMVMFVWGASVYFHLARPPGDAMEVYVVGKQWMWKIQHPDGQREINELHVPVGVPVKLTLTSEDVIHDFFVPAFRTKVDVLPGRYVNTWFQATQTGRFHLFCAQYCGTNHSGMIGSVVVQEPARYQEWLTSHAEGSLALEGRKLFLKYQCATCHTANARARAPVLEGVFGQTVHLRDKRTVLADETYLRESILKPDAKVVAGFDPIMPPFQGQIDEEEMIKLIAFIKALKPGETPPRIETAEPPVAKPNVIIIPAQQP